MITSIDIRNLGVIAEAHADFGPGLTVVTGETGAGKTMVLSSLLLLLGGRADAALVRQGAARLDVDGVFEVDEGTAERAEEAGGVIEDGELIVGRTVPARGRSRARLGGRPVPASAIAGIVGSMVTIHGQSDQIRLTSQNAQREALDRFGEAAHQELVASYREAFHAAVAAKKRLDAALADRDGREEEIEDLAAATARIASLGLAVGEEEELARESARLTNVQDLRAHCEAAQGALRGGDSVPGAIDLARQALAELEGAGRYDESVVGMCQRLQSQILEVEALADDVSAYSRTLEPDPAALARVHERRAAIKDALRGRAGDIEGLLAWNEAALERLEELSSPDSDPEALERALAAAQERVLELGGRLSEQRRRLADSLSAQVDEELRALSMPDASLSIALTPSKPTSHGLETIGFLLRPHPSAPPRPLGSGASGGELSRVMLALELILGRDGSSSTFVFDEIDAGIGGQTATEVGARLARLAENHQVIVVTHLAQVAAFASHHLVIAKEDGTTSVRAVTGADREAELTRMMGGDPHSPTARRNAIEVLGSAVSQSQG